jgi:DNA-binding transcriptional regulator YhcF (GntR family)
MKLWISKRTEVPIREQLITQITLAVTSGDIVVGEKLPSRGELARRFAIHENTVSNAYKILADDGLIEFRRGSGFFAKEMNRRPHSNDLEYITAKFLSDAASLGAEQNEVRRVFLEHLDRANRDRFVIIDADPDLADILAFEIESKTGKKVVHALPTEISSQNPVWGIPVAMADEKRKISDSVPGCIFIQSSSIPEALSANTRPEKDALIAIVSGWDGFLKMASTILVAAGIESEAVLARSTKNADWKKGLESATLIIADARTASVLEDDGRLRVFPFVSRESMAELVG